MQLTAADTTSRDDKIILIWLFIAGVLIRLPYFFYSAINGDESTFILMGRDILEGHLPYVHLWDNKPPLSFLLFAIFILFGRSIVGVRLMGACYIALVGCVVYSAARRLFSPRVAIFIGLLAEIFSSVVGGSMAVMMEHLASLPLAVIAWFLVKPSLENRDIALIGLWLGIAALIRTNLYFLMPGIWLLLFLDPVPFGEWVKRCILAGVAALVPLAIATLIYLVSGHLDVFLNSFLIAPLKFIDRLAGSGEDKTYLKLVMNCIVMVKRNVFSRQFILWLLLIPGIAIGLKKQGYLQLATARLLIFGCFIFISIVMTAARYDYYLIQFFPVACLLCGFAVEWLVSQSYRTYAWAGLAVSLLFPLAASIATANNMTAKFINGDAMLNDEGYQLANYLRDHGAQGKLVYTCDKHIIYFLLDSPVPNYIAHPQNMYVSYIADIIKGPGHNVITNFQEILDQQPAFIVMRSDVQGCGSPLKFQETHAYTLDGVIGPLQIYRRLAPGGKVEEKNEQH